MRTAPWPSPRVPRPLSTPLWGCRRSASFVFEARRRKGSPWPSDKGHHQDFGTSPRFLQAQPNLRRSPASPGRERDVLASAQKQTDRRGETLAGEGVQINRTGSCFRAVWGKPGSVRCAPAPKSPQKSPMRPGSPWSTDIHGSGVMGIDQPVLRSKEQAQPGHPVASKSLWTTSIAPGPSRDQIGSGFGGRERAALPRPRTEEASPGHGRRSEVSKGASRAWAKPLGS